MTMHPRPARAEARPIAFGVARSDRKQLADALSLALVGTRILYGFTQHVHRNATGPLFHTLHRLTEAHYEAQAEAIDALAGRIRAIGFAAPGRHTPDDGDDPFRRATAREIRGRYDSRPDSG